MRRFAAGFGYRLIGLLFASAHAASVLFLFVWMLMMIRDCEWVFTSFPPSLSHPLPLFLILPSVVSPLPNLLGRISRILPCSVWPGFRRCPLL